MSNQPLFFAPLTESSNPQKSSLLDFQNKCFPLSPWSKEYLFSFLADKRRHPLGFAFFSGEKAAGLILGRSAPKNPRLYNLSLLVVDKNYRGKNLGSLLLKKFIKTAASLPNIEKICLHFRESNDLRNYYSRFGFTNHKISGKYSNAEAKHSMELILKTNKQIS